MILDHIGITVRDFARSKEFYTLALAPLGIVPLMEHGQEWIGFGRGQKPEFWFGVGEPTSPIHVAFAAKSRDDVDAFYEAAIAAGGVDNGPPGVREIYHPRYYGGFVLDLDGHNIEAVHHGL
jgi:catechol 2,3-dioxygenase-like lactoylglutathione lyase family enzyme